MISLDSFVIGAMYGVLVGFTAWGLGVASVAIIRLVNK